MSARAIDGRDPFLTKVILLLLAVARAALAAFTVTARFVM